jgi:hypothetical protein
MASKTVRLRAAIGAAVFSLTAGLLAATSAEAAPQNAGENAKSVIAHWTKERREAAVPRDFVLDHRGLGYQRRADGGLEPYGHSTPAEIVAVEGGRIIRPSAGSPSAPAPLSAPQISNMNPSSGAKIGASHTFQATVTDPDGLRSVSFFISDSSGSTWAFSASRSSGDVWGVSLTGFTDGAWSWRVEAKDRGPKGGATGTAGPVNFEVRTSVTPPPPAEGGSDGDVVARAEWTTDSDVKKVAGRIYFQMPTNKRHTSWSGYICSGTAVTDSSSNTISLVLTAAHCVYDDVNKAFARYVMFIPDQAASGTSTDRVCSNDKYGCWVPTRGYVHSRWASTTWPNNIPWDYAFYAIPTSGAHTEGLTPNMNPSLESNGTLGISWSTPTSAGDTHALGYPGNEDPKFMYCRQGLGTNATYGGWFLDQCGLTGGASGGPWIQPLTSGAGPIISVNSYGYSGQPGMGGPKLTTGGAACVYASADRYDSESVARGKVVNCSG